MCTEMGSSSPFEGEKEAGVSMEGEMVASARAAIPDGLYKIRVGYNTERVISMLMN